MSDQISERMLERARLGELDEGELADLVSRLEREEGGTQRLDALIEADAEFLEQYPSKQVVPLIRERLRRREREHSRRSETGSTMLAIRRVFDSNRPQVGALVVLFVLAGGITATWLVSEPNQETGTVVDSAPEEAAGARPARAKREPTSSDGLPQRSTEELGESEAPVETVALRDRLDRRLTPSNELIMEPRDTVTLDSSGARRIAIDQTSVVEATVDDESGAITFRAKEVGLTGVRVFFADHNPSVMYVRVAEPYSPDERFAGDSVARAPVGVIEACYDAARQRRNSAGEIAIRVLTSRSGEVSSAHAEWSSLDEQLEDCLVASAYQHEFPEVEGGAYRTAVLEFEFVGSSP